MARTPARLTVLSGPSGVGKGTVVAEVSIGLRGGVGRLVIEYAQAAGGDPAKPWAPILGAVLLGLVAAGLVMLLAAFLKPFRRTEISA